MQPSRRRRVQKVSTRMRRDCHPSVFSSNFAKTTWPTARGPHSGLILQRSPLTQKHEKLPTQQVRAEAPPSLCKEIMDQLETRFIHNRVLDIFDSDLDGKIDTDWDKESNKDRHFCTAPSLSPPGRMAFSKDLFPGAEKLYILKDPHKLFRTKLGILSSPTWTRLGSKGRRMKVSAPPGLSDIAPVKNGHEGHMKIISDIVKARERRNIQQKESFQFSTYFGNASEGRRNHPSHFQTLRSDSLMKDSQRDCHQRWGGPNSHLVGTFRSAHFQGMCNS